MPDLEKEKENIEKKEIDKFAEYEKRFSDFQIQLTNQKKSTEEIVSSLEEKYKKDLESKDKTIQSFQELLNTKNQKEEEKVTFISSYRKEKSKK